MPSPASWPALAAIVIEPDREVRAHLSQLLAAHSERVAAVGSPLAARASAAHCPPSLIVAGPGVDDEVFAHLTLARSPRGEGCDVMRLVDDTGDADAPHTHHVADAALVLRVWADAHAALMPHSRASHLLSAAVLGSPDPVFVLEFPPRPRLDAAHLAAANAGAAALLGVPAEAAVGRTVMDMPGAASLADLLASCERAVESQAAQELEVEVDGRFLACRILPTGTSVTVTSADISVPRRDVQRRAALAKIADGVAHAMPFTTLCRMACDQIASQLPADLVAVGRREGERVRPIGVNSGAPMSSPGPADGAASALAAAGRTGRAARTVFAPGGRDGWPGRAPVEEVAVPLSVDGETWGAIMAATSDGTPIPPDAEGFMESMAHLLSVAIGHDAHRRELITHARTDGLTGLPNRRAFEERLDEEVARAQRHTRPLALSIIDIDHFKAVNDTHGHGVGDQVLKDVAVRLARLARVGDLVARLGGEEFAWLMPDTDARAAFSAIDRARADIAGEEFATIGKLTVSVGVCDLAGGPSRDELFRYADAALYRAKNGGRNRTERHRPALAEPLRGPEARAERRAELCRLLARALGWGDARARDVRDAVRALELQTGEGLLDPHMLWSTLAHEGWDASAIDRRDPAALLAVVRVWDAPSARTDAERRLRLRCASAGLDPAMVRALDDLCANGALAAPTAHSQAAADV